MFHFLLRRTAAIILTLLATTVVVFTISRLKEDPLDLYATPGGYGMSDAARAALSKKMGLDRPIIVQYGLWLGGMLHGDFGESILTRRSVLKVIGEKTGATIQLALASWVFATLLGVPLGVLSAVRRGSVWDYGARSFALLGQGLPVFWIALMGILVFAVDFHWFPTGGRGINAPFWDQIRHFVLPMITLGWLPAAAYLRLTRSSMLEVLDSGYIQMARAKGVSSSRVIWKHAFRNALIQPLTVSFLVLAGFLDGAVIIESVFSWPGLGRLAVQSVYNNDYPVLTAVVLLFGLVFVTMNLFADLIYAVIDPRIRLT